MTDDQDSISGDEVLIEALRDYNAPGLVPRDAVWERIRAARGAGAGNRPSRRKVWLWTGANLAAAGVLVLGIGIGRRMQPHASAIAGTGQAKPSAPLPRDSAKSAANPGSAPTHESPTQLIGKLHEATRETEQRVRGLAATEPSGASSPTSEANSLAYRLVVLQHLAGTEAMITSFRASAKRGQIDTQIAGWSRELLSTTRMLETSPATTDPVMKRLLEDLDLVIAQIVQYSTHGTNNPDELDLIEQSINQRGVITKLRGTLPGRDRTAGT